MQKIIARAGIASRRHAEELIRSGQVLVNGVVVTELGTKADPDSDRIEAAGRLVEQAGEARYFLLHKPPQVVSTMADPEGRTTLRHLLRGLESGVFPVGGLDYAVSGLVFLTSDGRLADAMFKAVPRLVQVYSIKLKGRPTPETLSKVCHKAQAHLRQLRSPSAVEGRAENPWYEVEVRGARRDALRHAFFEAGHPVEKMKRTRLGPLELDKLEEGRYRALEPGEVAALRRAVERTVQEEERLESAGVRPPEPKKVWRPRMGPPSERPMRPGGGAREGGRRPGRDRFAPAAQGGPPRGGESGERRFPPRGQRPGGFGKPPRSGGPPRGGESGERRFPPRGQRSGGFHKPPRSGGPRREDRGQGRGPGRGPGRGKFSPGGPRRGGPPRGKFHGRPGPRGGPPHRGDRSRPGGRPSGRPPDRPPRRRDERPNTPPQSEE